MHLGAIPPIVGPVVPPVVGPALRPRARPAIPSAIGQTAGPVVPPAIGPAARPVARPAPPPAARPGVPPATGAVTRPVPPPAAGPVAPSVIRPAVGPAVLPVACPAPPPAAGAAARPATPPAVAPAPPSLLYHCCLHMYNPLLTGKEGRLFAHDPHPGYPQGLFPQLVLKPRCFARPTSGHPPPVPAGPFSRVIGDANHLGPLSGTLTISGLSGDLTGTATYLATRVKAHQGHATRPQAASFQSPVPGFPHPSSPLRESAVSRGSLRLAHDRAIADWARRRENGAVYPPSGGDGQLSPFGRRCQQPADFELGPAALDPGLLLRPPSQAAVLARGSLNSPC